jgi:hypothetical protein
MRKRSWPWADQSQNSTQEAQRSRVKPIWFFREERSEEWWVKCRQERPHLNIWGCFVSVRFLSDERWVRSDPLGMFVPLAFSWAAFTIEPSVVKCDMAIHHTHAYKLCHILFLRQQFKTCRESSMLFEAQLKRLIFWTYPLSSLLLKTTPKERGVKNIKMDLRKTECRNVN